LALTHLKIPRDSQPAEIFSHCDCKVGARTLRVEILIAKPQQSSCNSCTLSRNPECPRMSEVQKSSWRGRKPPNVARLFHSHPRCRAILAASTRLAAPSLAIASDK